MPRGTGARGGASRRSTRWSSLLAGAFLLLALRAALTAEPWTTVALWLAGALAAHLADVARRWRR